MPVFTPPLWWPVLKRLGRWTPSAWWPVLAARPVLGLRARAPGSRRLSDSRSRFRGGPTSPLQCAVATIPVAPTPELAAVCYRPRRCSWPRGNRRSSPASTSRLLRVVAGFQVSISGRFWVSTEVCIHGAIFWTRVRLIGRNARSAASITSDVLSLVRSLQPKVRGFESLLPASLILRAGFRSVQIVATARRVDPISRSTCAFCDGERGGVRTFRYQRRRRCRR